MSDARLRAVAIALAVAGLAVAGYLTWIHYFDLEAVCVGGGGSCERVQSSEYADLLGVPVALIGVLGYAAILVSLLVNGGESRFASAFLALGGFGFSAYLTYLELFEIDAICQWCVASAVLMTALAAVIVTRMLRADSAAA